MQLKDDDLKEFVAIWKRVFNEEISLADARHHASQLVTLYLALAKRLPEENSSEPSVSNPPFSS
jgi:hypothetical protein